MVGLLRSDRRRRRSRLQPPLMQEPQTILLWPAGAPGALGGDDRDKPAITVYMPPNTAGPMTRA